MTFMQPVGEIHDLGWIKTPKFQKLPVLLCDDPMIAEGFVLLAELERPRKPFRFSWRGKEGKLWLEVQTEHPDVPKMLFGINLHDQGLLVAALYLVLVDCFAIGTKLLDGSRRTIVLANGSGMQHQLRALLRVITLELVTPSPDDLISRYN